jgi:formylglycine-generating enzyme required for sulfatase activity
VNQAAVYLVILISFQFFTCVASEMIQIPSGSIAAFWQSPVNAKEKNKKSVKEVVVNSFKMMRYPVTISEYQSFIKKNSQWDKKNVSSLYADESYLEMMSDKDKSSEAPVTSVSWFAARAFCQSFGMRLPKVSEWEYVAAASELKRDANKDEKFLKRI